MGSGEVDDGTFAPGIVGVSGDGFTVFICDSNDIALQILTEVVGVVVVDYTADTIPCFSLVYRQLLRMSIYRKNSRTFRCGCRCA